MGTGNRYYYLISGLPDLETLPAEEADPDQLKDDLLDQLHPDDARDFLYILYKNDNKNLLELIQKHRKLHRTFIDRHITPSAYTHQELEEGYLGLFDLPEYMVEFIGIQKEDEARLHGSRLENLIIEMYYEEAAGVSNPFLRDYFSFKRELKNLIAALNAMIYSYDIKDVIVGESELSKATNDSWYQSAEATYPFLGDLRAFVENKNMLALERKVDDILFDFVNERLDGEEFTAASVYAYYIRFMYMHRWNVLEEDKKSSHLHDIINDTIGRAEGTGDFARDTWV